jgi:hypothetical protein
MKEINDASALFDALYEFSKDTDSYVDWQEAVNDEALFESILNSLDQMLNALSFLDKNLLSATQQKDEIYTLTLKKNQLIEAYAAQDTEAASKAGMALEESLRTLLSSGNWLSKAEELLPAFEKAQSKGELTIQERTQFKPVQLAFGIFTLISAHEFAHFDDEENEQHSSFSFDDDEEDEEESDDDMCCDHSHSIDA